MIKIDTVLELGKSLAVKATKDDTKARIVIASVKFAGLPVDRDVIDEFMRKPVGWCSAVLFDEQGAPVGHYSIGVLGRRWRVSGSIAGGHREGTLPLLQAELTDLSLSLVPLGAVAEGTLTWGCRGDEADDVNDLLGNTCKARWEVTDGGQDDLFDPRSSAAASATTSTQRIIDGLGRMEGKQPDAGAA